MIDRVYLLIKVASTTIMLTVLLTIGNYQTTMTTVF